MRCLLQLVLCDSNIHSVEYSTRVNSSVIRGHEHSIRARTGRFARISGAAAGAVLEGFVNKALRSTSRTVNDTIQEQTSTAKLLG